MKILRWFILLCPGILTAQGFSDFEEDSLRGWEQLPPNRWEILAEAPLRGVYSLHHSFDNPEAGEDLIFKNVNYALASDTLDFSFRVKHAYNPSRGNNWQFFFLSHQPDQLFDCMVFGVNFTGSDDTLRLWQVIDGETEVLINTGINYEDEIGRTLAPQFFIKRLPGGIWSIKMDLFGEPTSLQDLGSGEEQSFSGGKFIGVRFAYSPAQDRKLWLDDICAEGSFERDEKAPILDTIMFSGLNSLKLCFDESILLTNNSRILWGDIAPDTVQVEVNEIHLIFSENFPNRQRQHLAIRSVEDLEGNLLRDTLAAFMQDLVEFGELVFNEIMNDPEPVVYLPAFEYLELFNTTEFNIDLSGWIMKVNSKEYTIDSGEIHTGEYLILSSENTRQHFQGKSVVELFTTGTALSNSGAKLSLFDHYSRLIHTIRYREMENYDALKSEGGWSLECVDPGLQCGGLENWKVSCHYSGGTPGEENSVMDNIMDAVAPQIAFIGIADTNKVSIHFSESVYLDELSSHTIFIKDLGPGQPIFYTTPLVTDVLDIFSEKAFREDVIYKIELGNIADCEANATGMLTLEYGLPKFPTPQMLVINELMYDPFVGQEEYLEFHNITDHFLDLKDLKIGVNSDLYSISSMSQLSECSHLIAPGQYAVISPNALQLRAQWDLNWEVDVLEMASWRTMPNEKGYLTLLNRSDIFMERFHYHDSMHHELLRDPSGVALERISAESIISAWTSASASVNYGTPGTENSQKASGNSFQGKPKVEPAVITPDLDGYNDVAEISLPFVGSESVVNIYVTDLHGLEIVQIVENGILGMGDIYFWDGHDMKRHLVLPGIYVIHIRITEERGESVFRIPCSVIHR